MPEDRRHIAVMFTDIVGYTALMGSDEDKAFDMLKRNHTIHATLIKKHNGKLIKEVGDGTLASFPLASDGVRCAMDIQKEAKSQNIPLKIGIHQGEMVLVGADVLGDSVNVASRLEEMSEEGCISISGTVYKDVKNKAGINTKFIGDKKLKNVDDPVKVYEVLCDSEDPITDNKEPIAWQTRQPYYIIAGFAVIIAAFLIWQFYPSMDTSQESPEVTAEVVDKSIAVLPFRDDSQEGDNQYFCDGMMEEILTHLQKIADLNVKSRTSVEQYRNTTKTIETIAEELRVPFLLEGSVRKYGDNFRITAQLIEASTGDHLWAETFDGAYTDTIFVVQANIAKRIASSLNAVITPDEVIKIDQKPTAEITAYDLVLKGREMNSKYWSTNDTMYLNTAHILYDRALEIDPWYADAIIGKGSTYLNEFKSDSAIIYANRFIELEPELSIGYMIKGECYRWLQQTDLAIENLKKAVELDPNDIWSNLRLGNTYCNQKKDVVTGFPYMQKALELERKIGVSPNVLLAIAHTYTYIGYYEKADKYTRMAIELQVGCYGIWRYSHMLLSQGKINEALYFTDSICNKSRCADACSYVLICCYHALGNYERVSAIYQNAIRTSTYFDEIICYEVHAKWKLGLKDEAKRIFQDWMIREEMLTANGALINR